MSNEVAKSESKTPQELIAHAIAAGADLDKLEKLMTLQERWEANEARKAYHEAMASFKKNAPKIDKDKKVSFGNTKYNHASLANVTELINSELSNWGLSASWITHQNGSVSVTCRITHKLGHSEETTLSAAADSSGSKNSIQAIGSTISYLCRYSLLCLCGLATHDQDDDAQSVVSFISDKEQSQLLDLIADKEVNIPKFLEFMGVESIEKMPTSKFQQAYVALTNKKKVAK